jgi:hypothetical protein
MANLRPLQGAISLVARFHRGELMQELEWSLGLACRRSGQGRSGEAGITIPDSGQINVPHGSRQWSRGIRYGQSTLPGLSWSLAAQEQR